MEDDWIAMDKLQHFLMCFLIATVSTFTIRFTLNPTKIMHRWATWVGCILALMAGAAKEVGDEMGIWRSAGASVKDALADGAGVLVAALLLYFIKPKGAKHIDEGIPLHGSMIV